MYGANHIHQFDHDTAMAFKAAVEKKLEEVSDEFGVAMKIDKVSMKGRDSMGMALTACVGSEVKLEDTPSGKLFLAHCKYHGIPESALGKTVRVNKRLFRVIGWAPNARKYCVEGEDISNGKIYRLMPSHVKGQV